MEPTMTPRRAHEPAHVEEPEAELAWIMSRGLTGLNESRRISWSQRIRHAGTLSERAEADMARRRDTIVTPSTRAAIHTALQTPTPGFSVRRR